MLAIFTRVISTIFSYTWDIFIDWGLMQEPNLLRDRVKFPTFFYYQAIVTNLLLRFVWVVPLVMVSSEEYCWFKSFECATILALAELFRRWQWALLRIENEEISNPERYRHIFLIPEIIEPEKENKERCMYENMLKKINQGV